MKAIPGNQIPLVIVISGPSGVGKDATLGTIKKSGARFHYVITATTRPKRPAEKDGADYYFLTEQEFQRRIDDNEFLEHAEVYGHRYGILKKEVRKALEKGEDAIIKVDVQGAATLKRKVPDAIYIYLLPASIDDLAERLKGRNADSKKAVIVRLNKAAEEMKKVSMFDYQVINCKDNLHETAETVTAIVAAEKCRVNRRKIVI